MCFWFSKWWSRSHSSCAKPCASIFTSLYSAQTQVGRNKMVLGHSLLQQHASFSLYLTISLFLLLSISLSLKLRQSVVVFAIWSGSSVEAAERRILLPCRSIRLCMRGGKLQLRCRLFVKKAGKGTHAGGKRGFHLRDANVDRVLRLQSGENI